MFQLFSFVALIFAIAVTNGVEVHWTKFHAQNDNINIAGEEAAQYSTTYGGGGGGPFTQDCVHRGGVKSIKMECGSNPGSIQLTCGDNFQFGVSGLGLGPGNGSDQTYTPPDVNGITKVDVYAAQYVEKVEYFSGNTKLGNTCGSAAPSIPKFTCQRPSSQYRLCAVKGRAGHWMDQWQCGWCRYQDSGRFCATTSNTEGGNQDCINFRYWRGDGNICGPCGCSGCPLVKRRKAWCRKPNGTSGGNQLCIDIKYNANPSQNICGPCGCSGCPLVTSSNKWCRKTNGSAGGNQNCIDWLQHQNPAQNTCGPCGCSGCPLQPRTNARCRKVDGSLGGNQDCIDHMYNQNPAQNICGPCGCSGCPLFVAPPTGSMAQAKVSVPLFVAGGVFMVMTIGAVWAIKNRKASAVDYQALIDAEDV